MADVAVEALAVKVYVIVIAVLPPLDTVRTVEIHEKDEFFLTRVLSIWHGAFHPQHTEHL